MSIESEIEALRDDVRSLRATLDSLVKTFQGDVMQRLATLEQWKIYAHDHVQKAESKSGEFVSVAAFIEFRDQVKKLVSDSDKMQGAISSGRMVGGLVAFMLAAFELAHMVLK